MKSEHSETCGTPPEERQKRAEIISEDVMFDNIQNLRKHTNLLMYEALQILSRRHSRDPYLDTS